MTQRQHGSAQTSLRISSAISRSCFSHSLRSLSYLSRLYSRLAALLLVSSASRSVLKAFALSALVISLVCAAIRSSMQLDPELGPGGHSHGGLGQRSGSFS